MSDYVKAMTDFWSTQSKAMLDTQQAAIRSMSEGAQAMLAGKVPTLSADGGAPETGLAQATDALAQLWTAATALSGELAGNLKAHAGHADNGAAAALFERITDPRQWVSGTGELDDVLARLTDGPRLADLWDVERRSARMVKAWTELRRQTFEQQRIMLDAWLQAGRRYMEELAGRASADGKPLEPKQAFKLWTEVANQHLIRTQRSEAFLTSQLGMIRANTELRLAQSDLGEYFGKQHGLPTRSELDDVHRSLTELRREVRRLRRELANAPAVPVEIARREVEPAYSETSEREAAR